jgi:hypothetical protein
MISYPWTVSWEAQGTTSASSSISNAGSEVGNRPRSSAHGNRQQFARRPRHIDGSGTAQMRKIMYNQRAIPAPA